LRRSVWESLSQRGHDTWRADLTIQGRSILLELRGLPFGDVGSN
jgi:hypothetical protein